MTDSIIFQIEHEPIWSFSQLVGLEGGECMQINLECSLHAEIIDNKLVIVVTLLEPSWFNGIDAEKIKNMVKQEIWDRCGAIPSVVLFHPNQGLF